MSRDGPVRLRPVRLRRPDRYGGDAGPLIVGPERRRVEPGDAGYPDQGGATMPYPRAARGPLTCVAGIAGLRPARPARRLARTLVDAAAWLVWLVPAVVAMGPPGKAGLAIAMGFALAGLLLQQAASLQERVHARDQAVAVHGRVWDRLLSRIAPPLDEPPERIETDVTQSIAAMLAAGGFARRALGPACALAVALPGAATVSRSAGAGLPAACLALIGLAAWCETRRIRAERHTGRCVALMEREAGVMAAHLARLRDLGVASPQGVRLTGRTQVALAAAAVYRQAGEQVRCVRRAGPAVAAATVLALASTEAQDPADLLVSLVLASVAIAAAIELGLCWAALRATASALVVTEPLFADDTPSVTPTAAGPIRSIRLRGIAYRHAADRPPVLRGVDLDVTAGAVVALSGPSGAGKSTLLRILMGLIEPTVGSVTVDGAPLSVAAGGPYRARIAAVFQDEDIGFGTVRGAVAAGRADTHVDAVRRALDEVGLLAQIEALPMGLQTLVVAGAFPKSFSHRLMIARCLAAQADLIVLDEALSPLSTGDAVCILAAVRRRGAAVVFSTHRPDLLALADRVLHLAPAQAAAGSAISLTQ